MKYKVIRNYSDANKLLALGHKILKIDRDRNNRDYLVFLFEKDDTIDKDLNNINNK